MKHKIICGDAIEELKKLLENSVDACVTDPPYELNFMNKGWDRSGIAFHTEMWQELHRVLKPGAHILVAGIARTHHRMWVALEDAGFEIRDGIYHVFGSGFPKSTDISKQIDKMAGAEREAIARYEAPDGFERKTNAFVGNVMGTKEGSKWHKDITAPSTEEAIKGNGGGTALKPSVEIWCLARKPISECNIASNVLKWGVGGINVDGCRIPAPEGLTKGGCTKYGGIFGNDNKVNNPQGNPQGRFPANLILECCCEEDELVEGNNGYIEEYVHSNKKNTSWEMMNSDLKHETHYKNEQGAIHTNPNCVCRMLDEQSGDIPVSARPNSKGKVYKKLLFWSSDMGDTPHNSNHTDKGGASRFFYCAKASQNERYFYCTICKQAYPMKERDNHIHNALENEKYKYLEFHPTQKPLQLIQYLVKLVTPPHCTVLDLFMGTGTTLVAAEREGFNSIGVDSKLEYCRIAERRLKNELIQLKINQEHSTIEKIGF